MYMVVSNQIILVETVILSSIKQPNRWQLGRKISTQRCHQSTPQWLPNCRYLPCTSMVVQIVVYMGFQDQNLWAPSTKKHRWQVHRSKCNQSTLKSPLNRPLMRRAKWLLSIPMCTPCIPTHRLKTEPKMVLGIPTCTPNHHHQIKILTQVHMELLDRIL